MIWGENISVTLEDFSSHKIELWQVQKSVACGAIHLQNRLEIKYNQENLWNNAPKPPCRIRQSNSFIIIKRRKKNTGELAVQNFWTLLGSKY